MTPYSERTKAGKLVWRIAYYVAGRRVRKSFRSLESAERWMRKHRNTADLEGRRFANQWLRITNKEKHEVVDSLKLIRKLRETDPKASLIDAATAYCARRAAILKSINLRDAIDGFLASKGKTSRKGKLSEGWLKVLETCLNKAYREIADNHKTLAEFSTEELEIFLDDLDVPPRTWNNYRDYLFGVFKWGIAQEYITVNPVAKIEKYGKKMLSKEVILPPLELFARAMKLSLKPKYLPVRPALDLGLGLMMRSCEIGRLEWDAIAKDVIRVSSKVGKYNKPRNIHRSPLLEPVFKSLMRRHQTTGPVVPKNWRRLLTELFEEAGLGQLRNMLRKTSSSCHYHATGNEALTREIMGHADDSTIFGEVYRALDMSDGTAKKAITKKDGEVHFDLWKKY